jgi:hypothetical protein
MHLVNILRIITFSFLVGHSILIIRDFNSFRGFWDTLYYIKAQEAQARFARARLCLPYNKGRKETLRPK